MRMYKCTSVYRAATNFEIDKYIVKMPAIYFVTIYTQDCLSIEINLRFRLISIYTGMEGL